MPRKDYWFAVLLATTPLAQGDETKTASVLVDQPAAARQGQENEAEYTLRYKFKDGELIRWRVTHMGNTETTIQGNTQASKHRSVSTKLWRVTQVDEVDTLHHPPGVHVQAGDDPYRDRHATARSTSSASRTVNAPA